MSKTWMVYGATGYTGRLIVAQAKREGLTPILGARGRSAVDALAHELEMEARAFVLDDPATMRAALKDVAVVAHCAGPFSATSAPMRAACRDKGCHYVDITGEVAVFEAARDEDAAARDAGTVLCPGVGFDVIPTDCVAASLKSALPDATYLALGFETNSGISKGTATTALEGLWKGGLVRRNGRLCAVPLGHGRREIDFGRGARTAVAIPWGDVATAYHGTEIPNIKVFVPMPKLIAVGLPLIDPLRPLLASRPIQTWLEAQIAKRISGPDEAARGRHQTRVWGEVCCPNGQRRVARLQTANIYDVTIHGTLMAVRHLLSYEGRGGYFTPSQLMGERCVEVLPGSGKITIES